MVVCYPKTGFELASTSRHTDESPRLTLPKRQRVYQRSPAGPNAGLIRRLPQNRRPRTPQGRAFCRVYNKAGREHRARESDPSNRGLRYSAIPEFLAAARHSRLAAAGKAASLGAGAGGSGVKMVITSNS